MGRRYYAKNGEADRWVQEHAAWQGDECLIWPYRRNEKGYPVAGGHRRMHREMCELANGAPPTPKHEAAHSCGNGSAGCINPRHLSWKTHAGNMADMVEHGHSNRGTKNPMAKLTEDAVREIRSAPRQAYGHARAMAAKYGVSKDLVVMIRRGERWGWVE